MGDNNQAPVGWSDKPDLEWASVALSACRRPGRAIPCPACGAEALCAQWNIVRPTSREADVDLKCSSCSKAVHVRVTLPWQALDFYPLTRVASLSGQFTDEMARMMEQLQRQEKLLPAAMWMLDPLWLFSGWSATTFRWHPRGEQPPVMGLVFDNAEAGKKLFRNWTERWDHTDELEEIRVAVIEGDLPGQDPGYSVHICPDPENSLVRATAEGVVLKDVPVNLLGQVRRMHPISGAPPLLPRFKEEFQKHGEFLLAPVTRRADDQLWLDVECGIVKNVVYFRNAMEIGEGDIDAVVFRNAMIGSVHVRP